MTAAIIIARGGSKRLPRKNVLPFCGHPLVAWSIVQAKCSHLIDNVYVSTDDDEIENISLNYGAIVIRRPDWKDADQVSAGRPFLHAMKYLLDIYGDVFDTVVAILPTSPVKGPSDMDDGIRLYRASGVPNLVPLILQRETVLYRRIDHITFRMALFDKSYNYMRVGATWNITRPRRYIAGFEQFMEQYGDSDAGIDKLAEAAAIPPVDDYYITVPGWQFIEVDTAEEFELGEVIFEHYVLKGRGMEAFYEYSRANHSSEGRKGSE